MKKNILFILILVISLWARGDFKTVKVNSLKVDSVVVNMTTAEVTIFLRDKTFRKYQGRSGYIERRAWKNYYQSDDYFYQVQAGYGWKKSKLK